MEPKVILYYNTFLIHVAASVAACFACLPHTMAILYNTPTTAAATIAATTIIRNIQEIPNKH